MPPLEVGYIPPQCHFGKQQGGLLVIIPGLNDNSELLMAGNHGSIEIRIL
jgi:hypothetical protein